MRKTILLLCFIATTFAGCAPRGDVQYRAREERRIPDPTLGTDNGESQWYKTQILASPSSPTEAMSQSGAKAPGVNAPAKQGKTSVPIHAAPATPSATQPVGQ